MEKFVKLVVISDTHGLIDFPLPKGDILIHCGDFSLDCNKKQLEQFCAFMEGTDFEHKIVIGGNHDYLLDPQFYLISRFLIRQNRFISNGRTSRFVQ